VLALSAFEKHLIRENIIDEDRLARARASAAKTGAPLVVAIEESGFATADILYRALADFCELRYTTPSKMEIPEAVVSSVPARFATHYDFVPIAERNGTLVIAVSDPLNNQLLDDIRLVLKRRIEPTVATPAEVVKATKNLYGVGADTMERIVSGEDHGASVLNLGDNAQSSDLGDENIDASIIKFTNEIILEAINSDCTDIHIEPFEDQLRVRYRIDGILHQVPVPPSIRGYHSAIVSRIKIMANMNIAERRLPQDGKILARFGDGQYDLRVSILPTPHGETVNVRILSRATMSFTLDMLGFLPSDLKQFETYITKPHGIILVTGPTGSGKTTTLYAALNRLNSLDRKILTIEDPIEYQLKGITQMQVAPKIGFDFGVGLRAMLRHDPDIMLVGEIRDYETAEMAIRSSLTGHLVLSTLHTNDAAGAVTRLIDMGVEPFLISSTMIAAMAQRLLRRVCADCATIYTPDPQVLRDEFGVDAVNHQHTQFRQGVGCDLCRHTGYRGRIAIYEMLPFSPAVKEMTNQRANAHEIKKIALKEGLTTLRTSGWQRVCQGMSTIEEVLRVTADAEVMREASEAGHAAV
jgi:type II secretory ATPase GspE/PulE/Tfp pilus assembly ATPase PilB-like protein